MDADFPFGMVEEIRDFLREDRSPNGRDLYPEIFDTSFFYPLQRQAEMAQMTGIVRACHGHKACGACDGDGTLMYQWAKEACVKAGGYKMDLSDGSWCYYTKDHKEIPFKTIGGPCSVCWGEKVVTSGPKTVLDIGTDKGACLYHWLKAFPTIIKVISFEIRGHPYKDLFEAKWPHVEFWWGKDSTDLHEVVGQGMALDHLRYQPSLDLVFIDGDKTKTLRDFDVYRPLMSPGCVVLIHDIQDEGPKEAFQTLQNRGYRSEAVIDLSDTQRSLEQERSGFPAMTPHDGWLRYWRGRSAGVGVLYIP